MVATHYNNGIKKALKKEGAGKKQSFLRSTKTNSPTGNSGATSLPPIGDSLMYIETSANNKGAIVFCKFERTDFIEISNMSFC